MGSLNNILKSLTTGNSSNNETNINSIHLTNHVQNNDKGITLACPIINVDFTLTLPNTTGFNGQSLITDGFGNLSFATLQSGGGGGGGASNLYDLSDVNIPYVLNNNILVYWK